MAYLKAIRTLLAYVILGVLCGVVWLPLMPFMKRGNLPFRIWYLLDVLICTIAHDTTMRTLSGWAGQHMATKKRYRLIAAIIDTLASLAGDLPQHCYRAYVWEQSKGVVL